MQEVVTRADVAIVEYCPYLVTGRLDLIPSLRGLYFMDGNPLLDEVVSFAGVGGGQLNAGETITSPAEVYAVGAVGFSSEPGKMMYLAPAALKVGYVGNCVLNKDQTDLGDSLSLKV